jgi:hypothetical protein
LFGKEFFGTGSNIVQHAPPAELFNKIGIHSGAKIQIRRCVQSYGYENNSSELSGGFVNSFY